MQSTVRSLGLSSPCSSQRAALPQPSCRAAACARGFNSQSGIHGSRYSSSTSRGRTSYLQQALPSRSPLRSSRRVRGSCTVTAAQSADIKDRAVAALPYLVPLFDGLRYGKFALVQFPFVYKVLSPLDPLLRIYTGIPFASLVVFFGIYAGIINNRSWSRYVRFNAMQAILLDIILILPGLFENIFKPPVTGAGLQIYVQVYNSIFFFVLACWLIGTVSCILGKVPRLPIVADAADQQVP